MRPDPDLSIDEELAVFCKGAVDVIETGDLRERLESARRARRPLVIKLPADPSAPDIHLGHTVVLWKLAEMQRLGHEIHFLIGDFTGRIGDPTGRSETRKQLTTAEVAANARTYAAQIHKILDPETTRIDFNSSWLAPMDFIGVIELGARYTVARLLERDDFSNRFREGRPIGVHELFYPLMQGYDSVAMRADVELGGTDQTFNLLVGRDLQRSYGQRPQIVLTMPLLEGTAGVQKMSKRIGNTIGINEPPQDIYGKVMSISDALMWKYMLLLTDRSSAQLDEMKAQVEQGSLHPMRVKEDLAARLVATYHGREAAELAAAEFLRVHRQRELPAQARPFSAAELGSGKVWVVKLTARLFDLSNSEARRQIEHGALRIDGERVVDPAAELEPRPGSVLQLGKHRSVKLE
ncbi:MAG: tyrosine--tRNA ligase [Candidatus Riflebacteria bacterium]|nr:tyrosine--tRNA ligase [Candidatus Riflebacteria bacterium]